MALASQVPAITGKLRKRLILDLSVALGGGTVAGYGYWYVTHRMAYSFFLPKSIRRYGIHLPSIQRRECPLKARSKTD